MRSNLPQKKNRQLSLGICDLNPFHLKEDLLIIVQISKKFRPDAVILPYVGQYFPCLFIASLLVKASHKFKPALD